MHWSLKEHYNSSKDLQVTSTVQKIDNDSSADEIPEIVVTLDKAMDKDLLQGLCGISGMATI